VSTVLLLRTYSLHIYTLKKFAKLRGELELSHGSQIRRKVLTHARRWLRSVFIPSGRCGVVRPWVGRIPPLRNGTLFLIIMKRSTEATTGAHKHLYKRSQEYPRTPRLGRRLVGIWRTVSPAHFAPGLGPVWVTKRVYSVFCPSRARSQTGLGNEMGPPVRARSQTGLGNEQGRGFISAVLQLAALRSARLQPAAFTLEMLFSSAMFELAAF
jgi:hypothetical protein